MSSAVDPFAAWVLSISGVELPLSVEHQALLVAVLLRQTLLARQYRRQARARNNPRSEVGRTEDLSNHLGRLGAHIALAIALIIVSMFLTRVDATYLAATPLTTSLVGVLVIGSVGLGYAAGRFSGEVYARTLTSVTSRFEQLASESVLEANQPLRTPVVGVFSGLFAELERLRVHLTDEIATYEQALEKTRVAHSEKEQFLAAVSHELRTPLNSICGFAHLMLEDTSGGSGRPPKGYGGPLVPKMTQVKAEFAKWVKQYRSYNNYANTFSIISGIFTINNGKINSLIFY